MMCYKLIVFYVYFIFTATRVRADEDSKYKDCAKLVHPSTFEKFCCKSMGSMEDVLKNKDVLECKPKDGENWTCKESTCIMEKAGVIVNGEVKEEGINAMLDKQIPRDAPEAMKIADRIRDKCLNGQYKEFPIKDCVGMQVAACIYMNALLECQTWKDEGDCKSIGESAAKCKAAVDA